MVKYMLTTRVLARSLLWGLGLWLFDEQTTRLKAPGEYSRADGERVIDGMIDSRELFPAGCSGGISIGESSR